MLNNEQIKKLLSMSDEELRKKIADAAVAAGADKFMTARALSDVGRLRGLISALDERQVNDLLKKIGPDAASELSKRIGEV
ncbi:MAG: hypothetical protein DBX61_01125 [Clostridiales bacterium]|nr:MAG: hypothetical protein DBX61_01125 [Clostridiales bacterium]